MQQKFRRFTFVKVSDTMPSYMWHFDKDFIGIVDGTYSQKYGGNNIHSYAIYKLDDSFNITNHISWYDENLLTEYSFQDREFAEELIEHYNLKD